MSKANFLYFLHVFFFIDVIFVVEKMKTHIYNPKHPWLLRDGC